MTQNLPAARKQTAPSVTGNVLDLGDMSLTVLAEADADDCRDWLRAAGTALRTARERVGLVLWRLRAVSPESVYAAERDRLAKVLDVTPDTLTRWRNKAEKAHGLDNPSPRSKALRDSSQARAARLSSTEPPPVVDAQQAPETAAGADKDAPVDVPSRPVEASKVASAAIPLPLDGACQRCGGTGKEPVRPQTMTRRPSTKAERGPRFARANCPHYPNARVGKMCMDCESEIR